MNYKLFKDIYIFGNHGCAAPEKELGQKFIIAITLYGEELKKVAAAISDDDIEQFVKEEGSDVSRAMAQTVAARIGEKIIAKATHDILEVCVEVKKPATSVRSGGGLVDYISTVVSKRREGYSPQPARLEDYDYTKIKSARVFDRNRRYEVDLEVAFPMETSIREDNIAYSYSYSKIYGVIVDTLSNSSEAEPEELLEKIVDCSYNGYPSIQKVRATIRNYLPENNLSVDYMEYQLVK